MKLHEFVKIDCSDENLIVCGDAVKAMIANKGKLDTDAFLYV